MTELIMVGPRRRSELDMARDWLSAGGSLLFFSPVRTGRSPVLDTVAASSGARRVLRCTPSRAIPSVPYFSLADLLSTITDAELEALPPDRRQLLSGALLRDGNRSQPAPGALAPAVLALLRELAQATPLLLVIDDLQRVDPATADLLQFIARNIDGIPIQMIASEWLPGDRPPLGYRLCLSPLLALPLDSGAPRR